MQQLTRNEWQQEGIAVTQLVIKELGKNRFCSLATNVWSVDQQHQLGSH